MTLAELLQSAQSRLAEAGCDTPRLDAELLISHALGYDRVWLYTHFKHHLTSEQIAMIEPLLQRREQREPVAYIIEKRDFYGLTFYVNPDVLVPRPETELLIETVLQFPKKPNSIIDVGTGSGCIAIALAKALPQTTLTAIDISPQALTVAQQNANTHHVTKQITFQLGNLLTAVTKTVDLIVSNPPYINHHDLTYTLAPEVEQYEPHLALAGGNDGLVLIQQLLQQAVTCLNPQGALLVEIGADQGEAVATLAQDFFPKARIKIKQDLSRQNRLLVVTDF